MQNNYFQIVFAQKRFSYSQKNIVALQFSKYKFELIQRFQNLSQSFNQDQIEAVYKIPINQNICLESFEATINGQIMKGYVKGKEDSQSLYDKGKESGSIVGYCEKKTFDQEDTDSLSIKIGNIPQNVFVDITLKYSQQISYMIAILKNDEQQKNTPTFQMNLQCSQKLTYYKSIGFQTDMNLLDNNTLYIQSKESFQNQNLLQNNFKLIFQFEDMHEPQVLYGKCESTVSLGNQNKQIELLNHSILLSFIPDFNKKFKTPITDTINASLTANQDILNDEYLQSFNESIIDQFQSSKSEFIFLLDRSGSMSGSSMEQAKQSLILFIKSLPQNSYFNVISFGDNYNIMFENSQQYSDETVNQSLKLIQTYSADMGGTEIYSPLSFIYNKTPRISGYGRQIYLLTDGEVKNKDLVLKLIRNNQIGNRVHSIGIGNSVDQNLILQSAKVGKGCHKIVKNIQSLQESIIQLLQNSISPILEQFQIKYNSQIFTSQYPNMQNLSCIFKDDLFNLFLYIQPGINIDDLTIQDKTLTISYFDSSCNQQIEKNILLDPQDAHRFDPSLQRSVFKIGMHFKLNQPLKNYFEQQKDIIQQSIEHQILTEYTSYFCEIEKINDEKRVQYWIPQSESQLNNKKSSVQTKKCQQVMTRQYSDSNQEDSIIYFSSCLEQKEGKYNLNQKDYLINFNQELKPKIQTRNNRSKTRSISNERIKESKRDSSKKVINQQSRRNKNESSSRSRSHDKKKRRMEKRNARRSRSNERQRRRNDESSSKSRRNERKKEKKEKKIQKRNVSSSSSRSNERKRLNFESPNRSRSNEKQRRCRRDSVSSSRSRRNEKKSRSRSNEKKRLQSNINQIYNLNDIINLVNSQGEWYYQQKIVDYFIQRKIDFLNIQSQFKSINVFMTFIMLWVLENKYQNEKNQWMLISKKANTYIGQNIKDLLEIAKLKQLVNDLCKTN